MPQCRYCRKTFSDQSYLVRHLGKCTAARTATQDAINNAARRVAATSLAQPAPKKPRLSTKRRSFVENERTDHMAGPSTSRTGANQWASELGVPVGDESGFSMPLRATPSPPLPAAEQRSRVVRPTWKVRDELPEAPGLPRRYSGKSLIVGIPWKKMKRKTRLLRRPVYCIAW